MSSNFLEDKDKTPFYDSWESLNQDKRNDFIHESLKTFITNCRDNSPFYQERLADYNPKNPTDLTKLPTMDSDTLRDLVPPVSFKLLSREVRDYSVFQSGGTTGFPKTTLFSHDELENLNLPNARGFYAMGLRAEDRVGNLFAVGGLYMTFIHINRMLQQYGCMNFPFSNQTAVDFIHQALRLYEVNCLTGITSVVLNALRGSKKLGLDGINIKKVYYGGEHIYPADKEELKNDFGVEVIGAPGYGTVDTWYIGYQCEHSPTGVFHSHDDQCFIEIVNEETGELCKKGEIGMVYATPFVRTLTPVVRYKVGDRARWIDDCSCGRTTPRFELLGRGDDILRIGYDSVDYNSIQNIVTPFKELSGSIQMEKRRLDGKDQLIIRIESDHPEAVNPDVVKKLEETILASRPTITDHLKKQTIHPLKIEILAKGSLPRNPRTGKLMRVVDAI